MQKLTAPLATAAVAILIALALTGMTSRAAGSYADDRSEIEDLQARYLLALDFRDPDLYVSTFTEDGILDVGSGESTTRTTTRSGPACSTASATTKTIS